MLIKVTFFIIIRLCLLSAYILQITKSLRSFRVYVVCPRSGWIAVNFYRVALIPPFTLSNGILHYWIWRLTLYIFFHILQRSNLRDDILILIFRSRLCVSLLFWSVHFSNSSSHPYPLALKALSLSISFSSLLLSFSSSFPFAFHFSNYVFCHEHHAQKSSQRYPSVSDYI